MSRGVMASLGDPWNHPEQFVEQNRSLGSVYWLSGVITIWVEFIAEPHHPFGDVRDYSQECLLFIVESINILSVVCSKS